MVTMRPIQEPAVLDSLNCSRFLGDVRGYVVMDGASYMGHMLFTVDGSVTTVQECGLADTALVDGGVRACVAAGENTGATHFAVNGTDKNLAQWWHVFCKDATEPQQNEIIFHSCK